MPLSASERLGPYEIIRGLGAGGMGEVYRARDTRLGREVALKILPEIFAHDATRRARFDLEARAASALNHPNIVTVHDLGEEGGACYIVTELVEGEPLRELIERGPVPARKLIDIAAQIADGLAAAHAAGITHRDLKPENIMLTREGRVKILDFGLAKLAAPAQGEATLIQDFGTDPGTVLGTVAYMSPEQARSAVVDWRSDQFSLGLILHEMAMGKQTFRRPSAPETMTAIIRDDAPALDVSIPPPLRWVIARLLEKDPEERYASTKDLARDLRGMRERVSDATSGVGQAAAKAPANRKRPLSIALAVGFAAGAVLAVALIPPGETDVSRYKFTPLAREEGRQLTAQWSPDGKGIVYVAVIHGVSQILTRAIEAPTAIQLTHGLQSCSVPFWSPDGLTVYYLSRGGLWSVGASGGAPRLVTNNSGVAAIHPDGKTFAFAQAGKLLIGPPGERKEFNQEPFPSQINILGLGFSPDGSKLAVLVASRAGRPGELWILPFPSGRPRRVAQGPITSVSWFPDNHRLLFSRGVSGRSSEVILDSATGRERTIWSSPGVLEGVSVAPNGRRIAFTTGANLWNLAEVSLPDGAVSTLLARGGMSLFPDWAPSGTHYLYSTDESGHVAIEDRSAKEGFARTLLSPGLESLPSSAQQLSEPRWAPDGQRFAFGVGFGGNISRQVWVSNALGIRPFPIDPSADSSTAPSWSPEGEWIAYIRLKDGKRQLMTIRASAGASPVVLADAAAATRSQTHWSPAGDWILYPSASGVSLVSPDGKQRRALTSRKFTAYGFSKSGDQVIGIFQNPAPDQAEWELYSVDVKTGAERRLAALNLPPNVGEVAGFSLHPDGKRFATSIAHWPYDIWMLEGFDDEKSWLDRVLRR